MNFRKIKARILQRRKLPFLSNKFYMFAIKLLKHILIITKEVEGFNEV